jgi:protein-S-isoprenylcysteine O-methyltransferase Ste14
VRAFAWAGALLFAGALAWFAWSYFVVFAAPAVGAVNARAIAVNVALFSAFALHHSVFARTPLRRWIERHAAGAERSIYVWIASLLFIAVCAWWLPVPGVLWGVSGPGRWVLAALQIFGVVLTLRGAAVLDVWELAGVSVARALSGPRGEADKPRPTFSTAWPYGWVRHPIYLGWFLLVWPVGTMTMTRFVFAAVSSGYLIIAIPIEEGTLRKTAPAYDDYRRAVRWRLIPGIF